jgi:hypothetical protein
LRRLLRSSGPCGDGAAVEIKQDGSQPAVKRVENIVMARDFNGVFWPLVVAGFKSRTWFDGSAKTAPLLTLVAEEDAVATACRAEVAGDDLGAVVGYRFGQGVLRWG